MKDSTEPVVKIPLSTLKWWRELVDLNPADLAPRMDSYIKMANHNIMYGDGVPKK